MPTVRRDLSILVSEEVLEKIDVELSKSPLPVDVQFPASTLLVRGHSKTMSRKIPPFPLLYQAKMDVLNVAHAK